MIIPFSACLQRLLYGLIYILSAFYELMLASSAGDLDPALSAGHTQLLFAFRTFKDLVSVFIAFSGKRITFGPETVIALSIGIASLSQAFGEPA